jgi:hypothetical protein
VVPIVKGKHIAFIVRKEPQGAAEARQLIKVEQTLEYPIAELVAPWRKPLVNDLAQIET